MSHGEQSVHLYQRKWRHLRQATFPLDIHDSVVDAAFPGRLDAGPSRRKVSCRRVHCPTDLSAFRVFGHHHNVTQTSQYLIARSRLCPMQFGPLHLGASVNETPETLACAVNVPHKSNNRRVRHGWSDSRSGRRIRFSMNRLQRLNGRIPVISAAWQAFSTSLQYDGCAIRDND